MMGTCFARNCHELAKIDVFLLNAKLGFCEIHADKAREIIMNFNKADYRRRVKAYQALCDAEESLRTCK